jgi:hypothetical protein
MTRPIFHTQENRGKKLKEPIICLKSNAWLGDGFYFWLDEQDAFFWGNTSKKKTGKYDVYLGNIDCDDVLDTVFNEEHYIF